jgi:hypothetical protein
MSQDCKIGFVYKTPDDEFAVETVWAKKVGDIYQIENIPFFAKHIAYADLVQVELEGQELYFDNLVIESGWSTIHVAVLKKEAANEVVKNVESLGLSWEGFGKENTYLAVGVPPRIGYDKVRDTLNQMAADGMIDYAESCISNNHKNNRSVSD